MEASAFGLKFISYMKFRFWKLKYQNATGVERVNAAVSTLMCIHKCIAVHNFCFVVIRKCYATYIKVMRTYVT